MPAQGLEAMASEVCATASRCDCHLVLAARKHVGDIRAEAVQPLHERGRRLLIDLGSLDTIKDFVVMHTDTPQDLLLAVFNYSG